MRDFNALFPVADSDYWRTSLSLWFLMALTVVTTMCSLIHVFLPDGGASLVTSLDTSVEGGEGLIAMFGQWGLEQLMFSLVAWVVILRFRDLFPLLCSRRY